MNIVLLGAAGQLGQQLQRSLATLGQLTALSRSGHCASPGAPPRPAGSRPLCGDISQSAALAQTLAYLRPSVVVNAAAYTQVDQAEREPQAAMAVNAHACAALAQSTEKIGAHLVHFSTDYVFDGSGHAPWSEADACHPLNAYGRSKRAGEQAIAAHCSRYWVFRTSWLYELGQPNFLSTVLDAAWRGEPLQVVSDQWGAPTRAAWVADAVARALAQRPRAPSGIYHLAAGGHTHWQAYAQYALQQASAHGAALKTTAQQVAAITAATRRGAPRPANSRLNTRLLQATFGIMPPPWQDGVRQVAAQWARQARA